MSRQRIRKRPAGTPVAASEKALHIPIKEKTAKNIHTMNLLVTQKMRELDEAQANLQNHILPLVTERGLPEATRIVQVTDKAPWELIVMVPKQK